MTVTTDRDALTPEELAAGDGYEPAMDDIDCTPRPRLGESLRKFRKRMAEVIIDGEAGSGAGIRALPNPHAEQDARFNRYLRAVLKETPESLGDDSEPRVTLERGEVHIWWPKTLSDREATVLPERRLVRLLAFQLDEVAAELRRRELASR